MAATADDKDRRTRMANSSVNQPMKKGGAGGSYTWGGIMDVQDYTPVGHIGQKVIVQQGPVVLQPTVIAQPMQVNIGDSSAFPSLGGTMAPEVKAAPVWGPGVGHVPAASLIASPMANGYHTVTSPVATKILSEAPRHEVFDAQRPRNTFARKPSGGRALGSSAIATTETTTVPQPDWSGSGMQGFNQAALRVVTTVGDRAPQQAPQVPLSVLRMQPPPQAYAKPQPIVQKHIPQKITQARAR
jgi:hypothetical protein